MGGPYTKKSPKFRPTYVVFDISIRQNWAKKPKPINPVDPQIIVFVSNWEGHELIYLIEIDGGNLRRAQ